MASECKAFLTRLRTKARAKYADVLTAYIAGIEDTNITTVLANADARRIAEANLYDLIIAHLTATTLARPCLP